MFLIWFLVSLFMMLIGLSVKRLFLPMTVAVLVLWVLYTVLMLFDLLPKTSISTLVIPLWVLSVAQFLFIFHYILMLFRLGRLTGGPTLLPEGNEEYEIPYRWCFCPYHNWLGGNDPHAFLPVWAAGGLSG